MSPLFNEYIGRLPKFTQTRIIFHLISIPVFLVQANLVSFHTKIISFYFTSQIIDLSRHKYVHVVIITKQYLFNVGSRAYNVIQMSISTVQSTQCTASMRLSKVNNVYDHMPFISSDQNKLQIALCPLSQIFSINRKWMMQGYNHFIYSIIVLWYEDFCTVSILLGLQFLRKVRSKCLHVNAL